MQEVSIWTMQIIAFKAALRFFSFFQNNNELSQKVLQSLVVSIWGLFDEADVILELRRGN